MIVCLRSCCCCSGMFLLSFIRIQQREGERNLLSGSLLGNRFLKRIIALLSFQVCNARFFSSKEKLPVQTGCRCSTLQTSSCFADGFEQQGAIRSSESCAKRWRKCWRIEGNYIHRVSYTARYTANYCEKHTRDQRLSRTLCSMKGWKTFVYSWARFPLTVLSLKLTNCPCTHLGCFLAPPQVTLRLQ